MFASVRDRYHQLKIGVCTAKIMPQVNSDLNFDDACALRMKGAKNSFKVIDISRDLFVNVEKIDDKTLEEEEQEVPDFGFSSKCMYFMSFGPLIRVIIRTIDSRSWIALKNSLSEAVKAPITAQEEIFDAHRDVVDGHLQLPDEGVAALFDEDGKKLLVEVIKEELKVRATVPAATIVI